MKTFEEYQNASRQTAIYAGIGEWEGVVYNTLKLTGEAGEVADKIGKIYGKASLPTEQQIVELKKEIGDIIWHVTNLCTDLGISLEDVAQTNIDKLRSRQERGMLMSGDGDNR